METAARFCAFVTLVLTLFLLAPMAAGQATPPLQVDREAGEVRVATEALRVDRPLEYICVVRGTADHESLLRTTVRPSEIHAGLLALGLEPGRPARYNEAAGQWMAPSGPPIRIEVEWITPGGTIVRERVGRLLRGVEREPGDGRRRQSMPPRTFAFVGSQLYQTRDGQTEYAADSTGQVVSLVNFEYPVIDVAALASSDDALLEWEIDPDVAPAQGTAVTMILIPILGDAPSTQPATQPATQPNAPMTADAELERLRAEWEARVLPQAQALRRAAQTHYEVMAAYEREINRLLDEAERLRREMEALQQRYNEMSTPQPTRREE